MAIYPLVRDMVIDMVSDIPSICLKAILAHGVLIWFVNVCDIPSGVFYGNSIPHGG